MHPEGALISLLAFEATFRRSLGDGTPVPTTGLILYMDFWSFLTWKQSSLKLGWFFFLLHEPGQSFINIHSVLLQGQPQLSNML